MNLKPSDMNISIDLFKRNLLRAVSIAAIILTVSIGISAKSISNEGVKCLRDSIVRYIADKDARIGVAILIDADTHTDTIQVNGNEKFPMLSVYKFPAALALADYCHEQGLTFSDTINIYPQYLHDGTWSPMRDRLGTDFDVHKMTISELVRYSLSESDNNAADIIFNIIGGPRKVEEFLQKKGFNAIHVVDTEQALQSDPSLCYRNSSTPLEMARLMDAFDRKYSLGSSDVADIARYLENCETGKDRLVARLSKDAVCGHKTGTGPILPPLGKLMAVNDAGYVRRIDGQRYAIAVFVADSAYDMDESSAIIAHISHLVRDALRQAD